MREDHERIVTPYSDPDRWDADEKALFDAGKCSWQIAYGGPGLGPQFCERPSRPAASFGYCAEHEAELLEEYHADGTPRYRTYQEWRAGQREAER